MSQQEIDMTPGAEDSFAAAFAKINENFTELYSALRLEALVVIAGDETNAITTGAAKVTFRAPYPISLTEIRASLSTASTVGVPTFDVNVNGVSILSTALTIDASEKTSESAAVPAVISDAFVDRDDEVTIDFDVAGTGAKGPKFYFIGERGEQ